MSKSNAHKRSKYSKITKTFIVLLSLLPFILVVVTPITWWSMNRLLGSTKVCTIGSAYEASDSSGSGGPAPGSWVVVESPDCGHIGIHSLSSPSGVNKAKLAEVLQQHSGEKFEFITNFIQLDVDGLSSRGVTSLTPVE